MAPQQTPDQPGLGWLDDALVITGQATQLLTAWGALVPVADFAIRRLFEIFRRRNPQLTPEQFYEYLKSQGRLVKGFSADWLTERGYTQDVDGEWQAPTTV